MLIRACGVEGRPIRIGPATPAIPYAIEMTPKSVASDRLGQPRATWLTFRRTYSSWSDQQGVPGKVTAQLMGHANVDTTLNEYTQVLDGLVRDAVERVGSELNAIERNEAGASTATAGNA